MWINCTAAIVSRLTAADIDILGPVFKGDDTLYLERKRKMATHRWASARKWNDMVINVKYFGMVAEAVGQGQEEIVLPSSELDLRQFFVARYPRLQAMTWKLAVDQELIEGIVVLQDHAEVVLLPPFAGG